MPRLTKKEFISQELTNDPKATGLKVGDLVKWENDNGVLWEHKVIGFCHDDYMAINCGMVVYLDKASYWFPLNPKYIKEINGKPVELPQA